MLDRFPVELFQGVLEVIYEGKAGAHTDLKSLRCVNKYFASVVTPVLFRDFCIMIQHDSMEMMLELAKRPLIGTHVKSMSIDIELLPTDPDCLVKYQPEEMRELPRQYIADQKHSEQKGIATKRLVAILSYLPQLRTVRIINTLCANRIKGFHQEWINILRNNDSGSLQLQALMFAVALTPGLKLQELQIKQGLSDVYCDHLFCLSGTELIIAGLAFTSIRNLAIEWTHKGEIDEAALSKFLKAMPNLQVLSLDFSYKDDFDFSFRVLLSNLHISQLRHLTLVYPDIEGSGLIDFYMKHKSSLQSLSLKGVTFSGRSLKWNLTKLRACNELLHFRIEGIVDDYVIPRLYDIPRVNDLREGEKMKGCQVQNDIEAYVLGKSEEYPSKGLRLCVEGKDPIKDWDSELE